MRRADPTAMRQALRDIQTFIKIQADQGATWAHLHIHDRFVDYQDDNGVQRRFTTEHIDSNLIHTFDAEMESHIAPSAMHVHLSNHATGRRAVDESPHRHMRNAADHNVVKPRTTENGRFLVHLAKSRRLRSLMVINPDGTAISRSVNMSIRHTDSRRPGAAVTPQHLGVRAVTHETTRNPADANDIEQVIQTGAKMLLEHMSNINHEPEGGRAWATADTRDNTPEEIKPLLPETPQTCAMYHGRHHGYNEILPPDNAVVPVISHSHGETVAAALDRWGQQNGINFITPHSEAILENPSTQLHFPTIRLLGVSVTETDGSQTTITPPQYPEQTGHGHDAYPDAHESHIGESSTRRVQGITLKLERQELDGSASSFNVEADTYVDHDWENFLILALQDIKLTPHDVHRMTGIGFQIRNQAFGHSFYRASDHQARILCQQEPNDANRTLLQQIADNTAQTGAHPDPGTDEVSVMSEDGSVTVTLRKRP